MTENERKTWCYSRNYAPLLENQKRYVLLQISNIRVYRVFNISSIIGQLCLKTDKNVRLMIYLYYMTENDKKTWFYSRNYAPLLENQKRYGLLQISNIRVYRVFNISSIIGQLCLKTDKNVRLMIYLYYMTENDKKTWFYSRNYAPLLENQKRYRLLQFSNIRVYRVFNISSIIGQLCLKTDKNVRLMIYLYYMTENERKTWRYSRNYAHLLENQKRYGLLQYSNIRVYRVFNISSIFGQICLKTDKNVRLMIYLYYMT